MAVSPQFALVPPDDPPRPASAELARFADRLKELHRLTTAAYPTLGEALQAHLEAGCRWFDLPVGLVLCGAGNEAMVLASRGGAEGEGGLETHLSAPIWNGTRLDGALSFSAPAGASRDFSPAERELVELMARSAARLIQEHQAQSDRSRREVLEISRNRVLQMVAENQNLEATLEQVARMVDEQCGHAVCSVLLLRDELLAWVAAPGLPRETARLLRPVRVLRGVAGLPTAEVARATVFWEDVRSCPFWAERVNLAFQLGIASCLSTPIRSAAGALLGMIALHYRGTSGRGTAGSGTAERDSASEAALLESAARLAGVALERRALTERLEFQARHDPLTGLPNRAHFLELLEMALRDAADGPATLAVLFIDLDRFKQINDILGHALGDRLLREVGGRLKRLLTEDDLAGRMGGDEFTIVLTHQPDEQAVIRAAQEFLSSFRAPHQIEDNELFMTASIGVAIYPQHGRDAAELLRNADLAMYHAKNSGKNDVEVFRAEDHAAGLERLRLETALRRALENQEFELLYQPLVGRTGRVEGLEALLTWRHPIYGTISPKQFIPIAEETGLIVDIGSWVIRQACLAGAAWDRAGYRASRISVNVSALQFERREFMHTVATALSLSNLPPDRLELELTESYLMRDLPQSAPRLAQLRDLGVSIAIDDFGTGYSSLSYLNKLPVDSLKIDQSFLRHLNQPEGSLPVLQSIVRLAHSMNLVVVVEGVETQAELELVRALGCDKVQGHVYGPALRREEVEALLAKDLSLEPSGL